MTQEQLNIALAILTVAMPLLLKLVEQWYLKRKNKIDYSDDLVETMNKTAASLREARTEITSMEAELRSIDKQHAEEIEDLKTQHNGRIERLKNRISDLEKVFVKYSVSFTLITHPDVQVTDLKVVGKESVSESQKMKAVTEEQSKK